MASTETRETASRADRRRVRHIAAAGIATLVVAGALLNGCGGDGGTKTDGTTIDAESKGKVRPTTTISRTLETMAPSAQSPNIIQ